MKLFLVSQNPPDLKAMATRRSGHQAQLASACDLRAELGNPHLHPLLDALAPSGKGLAPRMAYFTVPGLAVMMITLTGHLGGILSGVETP